MCELIKEYQKNKRDETYTKIFNKYNKDLKYFISSKFKCNSQILDDVIIMSFEQARIKIDSYDSSRPFKTWFYTLSKRLAIRLIENESMYYMTCFENGETEQEKIQSNNLAKKLLEQHSVHDDEHNPLLSKIRVDNDNDDDDRMLTAYDLVLDEISNLKNDVKEVVIDSYLNNMTFETIMSKYGLSESQVKLKLFTGRKEIRKVFHDKKVDNIKKALNIETLNISETLNIIIQDKLKYSGELLYTKIGKGYGYKYVIANNKVNLNAIYGYVEKHNKKINKEILEYSEKFRMTEDSSYAKSSFNKKIKDLEKIGYTINEEELKKAKDLEYNISVKGIKTRNRNGNSSSNEKIIKVEKLKFLKPGKLQQLVIKETKSSYLSIKVNEKVNIIKIEIK